MYSARSCVYSLIQSPPDPVFSLAPELSSFSFELLLVGQVYPVSESTWQAPSAFGDHLNLFVWFGQFSTSIQYTPMDCGTVQVYSTKCVSIFGRVEFIRRVGYGLQEHVCKMHRIYIDFVEFVNSLTSEYKCGAAVECIQ